MNILRKITLPAYINKVTVQNFIADVANICVYVIQKTCKLSNMENVKGQDMVIKLLEIGKRRARTVLASPDTNTGTQKVLYRQSMKQVFL